jgi:hypothetical protein
MPVHFWKDFFCNSNHFSVIEKGEEELYYCIFWKKRKGRGEQPESLLEAGFVMHFFSANIEHNAKRFYTSSLCNFVFPVLFSQVYIHYFSFFYIFSL